MATAARSGRRGKAVSALSDTAGVTWRNLLTQLRTPQARVFATIQPVILLAWSGGLLVVLALLAARTYARMGR